MAGLKTTRIFLCIKIAKPLHWLHDNETTNQNYFLKMQHKKLSPLFPLLLAQRSMKNRSAFWLLLPEPLPHKEQ